MFAARNNPNPDVIERLVKLGADVNARDEEGERRGTALMLAAHFNTNPDVLERLLKLGADVSHKNNSGQTALDFAKKNKRLKGTKAYQMLNDAVNKKK